MKLRDQDRSSKDAALNVTVERKIHFENIPGGGTSVWHWILW
jgi:hypothetical protein